jgi:hypothetical protein
MQPPALPSILVLKVYDHERTPPLGDGIVSYCTIAFASAFVFGSAVADEVTGICK